jgi:hypothetical protein
MDMMQRRSCGRVERGVRVLVVSVLFGAETGRDVLEPV